MEYEGHRGQLLGGDEDEAEARGKAWQGLGKAVLERCVFLKLPTYHSQSFTDNSAVLGKPISDHEEQIRGGLKYTWRQGVSHTSTKSPATTSTP